MKKANYLFIAILFLVLSCAQNEKEMTEVPIPDLVDRELFFGNPDKIQVRIAQMVSILVAVPQWVELWIFG